jgi:ABC-2 type transport system permease protein
MAPPLSGGVSVVSRALFNPKLDGSRFMVSGTFGFVLSFLTALITAVSIVSERLSGTFEQLQVTPATSLEILLGKILPLGAVFAVDVVLMVLAAGFLLGVWPEGNAFLFVMVSSFYVLTSLSLGLLISATSATAAEAVQKTVLFSIPLVQLSGFAFPIRSMPTPVRWLAELFPATHYIRVSRAIYLRGEGLLSLLPELALLALFTLILVAVALRSIEGRS